ncbi:MAG: YegS/Rv2252/BmrU family lipid kinase [Oscillospiraceae bacterium]|nr:YegS/Rv2252/BmrU family lipid kinase [Oscillospiraceae bacterium]
MKHLFIINPVAGGKKNRIEELKSEIETFAKTLSDPYEIYITKAPLDATRKIAEYPRDNEMLRVYACGGDGTLNECANGAANHSNIAITQYSNGTGNDFIKTFGQENLGKFRDLNALVSGTVCPLDLIDCSGRYGINIASVGIDARVGRDVHRYSGYPLIGGSTGYIVALLVNVIKGVTQKFKIKHEGKIREKVITLVCACNGRFYGGGFNPVPEALPDDGILDYLVVNGVSRFKVAQVVGKYAKGLFREYPGLIEHIRGENLEILSDKLFIVNIDGEIIETKHIYFKVAPKALNFILPAGIKNIQ